MLDIHVIWVRYGYFYYIAVVAKLAYGFMAFVRRVTPGKRQGHYPVQRLRSEWARYQKSTRCEISPNR